MLRQYLTLAFFSITTLTTSPIFAQEGGGSPGDEPGFWESIFRACFCWLMGLMLDFLDKFFDLLDFVIPDNFEAGIAQFCGIVGIFNVWVPVGFALELFIGWGFIYVGVRCYRFAKSWIPTVSG